MNNNNNKIINKKTAYFLESLYVYQNLIPPDNDEWQPFNFSGSVITATPEQVSPTLSVALAPAPSTMSTFE